jgi:AcrR family transcriptional regulator
MQWARFVCRNAVAARAGSTEKHAVMASETAGTARFGRKRDAILAAALEIIHRRGLKAMTFADVAEQVGLNPTSISYYFKKKEDLALACLLAGAARLEAMLREAEHGRDEAARLRRLFEAFFAHHRAVRFGDESPLPSFGEIRVLEDPHRSVARDAFADLTRRVRALFDGPTFSRHSRKAKTALAHLLLEQIFWAMDWLHQYDVDDYPRVLERTCDIYFGGLAGAGRAWRGDVLELPAPRPNGANGPGDDFLIAATRLINRIGYRGASVDRISAELNVTKGSFYHHNEAKEDLAAACFRRSFDIERRVQRRAFETQESSWERLEFAVCTLVDFQNSEAGPLAREWLLASLPEALRDSLSEKLGRVTRRFAGMIADGCADGSIRPVDPLIAAQMTRVTINAAAEGRSWVRGLERAEAIALYARPALMGVLASAPD